MKKQILTTCVILSAIAAVVVAINELMFFGTAFDFASSTRNAGLVTFESPYSGKEETLLVTSCNPTETQPMEKTIFIGINLHEVDSDEVYIFYNTSQPSVSDYNILNCWSVINTSDTKLIQSLANMTMSELINRQIKVTSFTAYE